MTRNNPVFANKGLAVAGAKRAGINNPKYRKTASGTVFVLDGDKSPLYDMKKRDRSKVDGACGMVWDIAAAMLKKGRTRKEILIECVSRGININTAKTQYQLYRQAAGLTKTKAA